MLLWCLLLLLSCTLYVRCDVVSTEGGEREGGMAVAFSSRVLTSICGASIVCYEGSTLTDAVSSYSWESPLSNGTIVQYSTVSVQY